MRRKPSVPSQRPVPCGLPWLEDSRTSKSQVPGTIHTTTGGFWSLRNNGQCLCLDALEPQWPFPDWCLRGACMVPGCQATHDVFSDRLDPCSGDGVLPGRHSHHPPKCRTGAYFRCTRGRMNTGDRWADHHS